MTFLGHVRVISRMARHSFLSPLAGMLALASASTALACAPTPEQAATNFLSAMARCDFVGAWELLAPVERAVFPRGVVDWSDREAHEASERIGCREQFDGIALDPTTPAAEGHATAVYVLATPVTIAEFRRLLYEREIARIEDWERLDRAIIDLRIRILQADNWEPRIRTSARLAVTRDSQTGWCAVGGYAARAAREREQDARLEREQQQRQQREVVDAEALRRGEAARPVVTAEAIRVANTTLGDVGVFGELVNGSRETLREVEIRVEYLDVQGRVIGQKDYTAILTSLGRGSLARPEHAPLPPGQRRRFGVRANDAPSTWARRVRVVVIRAEADPSVEPRDPPAPTTSRGGRAQDGQRAPPGASVAPRPTP